MKAYVELEIQLQAPAPLTSTSTEEKDELVPESVPKLYRIPLYRGN
jgi:hypothetical protein